MSDFEPKLSGLVPPDIKVRSARILLESFEVMADIGFHEFEVGVPQRLMITVEVWLQDSGAPADDDPQRARLLIRKADQQVVIEARRLAIGTRKPACRSRAHRGDDLIAVRLRRRPRGSARRQQRQRACQ